MNWLYSVSQQDTVTFYSLKYLYYNQGERGTVFLWFSTSWTTVRNLEEGSSREVLCRGRSHFNGWMVEEFISDSVIASAHASSVHNISIVK